MRAAAPKKVIPRESTTTQYHRLFALPQQPPESEENEKKIDAEGDSGISSASGGSSSASSSITSVPTSSSNLEVAGQLEQPPPPVKLHMDELTSRELFEDSYGHYSLHEAFLRDTVVTPAFWNAIHKNKRLFKDKVVLNIGCGLGTLALFAASAGASHVYAVDNSSIIEYARNIVELNRKSHLITLYHGTVEQFELPVEKVDVILSDWTGHAFFFNNLISSVLYARDKWLKPGGVIFPDMAQLHIAGIENRPCKKWRIEYWNSVFDFNMSALIGPSLQEPFVDIVDVKNIKTTSYCLSHIDLNEMPQGTTFNMPFQLFPHSDSYLHAVVTWFDVQFSKSFEKIGFSTSPYNPPTAYAQASFYLKGDLAVKEGELISGRFIVKEITKREAHFDIQVDCDGEIADYHEVNEFVMTHRRS